MIGAVVPITGPLTASGEFYYNSLQMAQDDVNADGGIDGKKLRIAFEDAQDSNSVAVNAFNKLVKEHNPPFIFLTSYSTQNLATEPEVAKVKIPVMYAGGATAVAKRGNPWMFRIRPNDGIQGIAMAKYVAEFMKKTRPGFLWIQNDFGQGSANDATAAFKKYGIEVVASEPYGATDKDFSAQLLAVKNKGADVILQFGYPDTAPLIIQQWRQLGITVPLFMSSGGYLPSVLAVLTEKDLDNTLGVSDGFLAATPKGQEYIKRYKERFKKDTDNSYGPPYYDAVWMIVDGIKKVGTDRQKLRDYIAGIKNHEGIVHTYSFDKEGEGVHGVTIVKMKPGTKDYELLQRIQVD